VSALDKQAAIAVVGAGTMGAGIAQVAAQAGHPVLLYDALPGAADAAIARTGTGLGKLVDRGKLSQSEKSAIVARLEPRTDLACFARVALVIEAIVEEAAAKRELFARLERIVTPDTILTSNTSSLSITALAGALTHGRRFAGLHFFNPAPIMRLVEVVSGVDTDPAVAETLADTARAWGKHPVHARSTPGFIVNRCARPFYGEALRVLGEGAADPATIDAIVRECGGFRMGPFELTDLIGQDVNFTVTRTMHAATYGDPRYLPSWIQQELVDSGRLGCKTGRGFYDYGVGAARPQPATLAAAPRPRTIAVCGDLGPAAALVELAERADIHVERQAGDGVIDVDGVTLALSDGRSATERAAASGVHDLVVFDLALDYAQASRIAVAPATQADAHALETAAGFFQALGKSVSAIGDVPGLVVLRTVSLLVNEAADAVSQRVCSVADLDTAMRIGVNYPQGPLAWAEALGLPFVLGVSENIARAYGEDRYRPSPLLRRKVQSGSRFHEEPHQ
jgi:3-hydroxybutyryl-CoA dehydrogenase